MMKKVVTVTDDGIGMNHDELNQNFLVIGRNRRKAEGTGVSKVKKKKVTGKKGQDKFSCIWYCKDYRGIFYKRWHEKCFQY